MVSPATHLNSPPFLRIPALFSTYPSALCFRMAQSLAILSHRYRDSESSERYGSPRLSWLIPTLSPQRRHRLASLHPDTITPTLFIRKSWEVTIAPTERSSGSVLSFLCGLGYFTSRRRKLTESSEQRGARVGLVHCNLQLPGPWLSLHPSMRLLQHSEWGDERVAFFFFFSFLLNLWF